MRALQCRDNALQACQFERRADSLVIIHRLIADAKIEVELEGYRLVDCYTDLRYEVRDGTLLIDDVTDYKAGAFLLKK